jgi:hypothetical protein
MRVSHYLPRSLPQVQQDLAALALDLRWSWHRGTDDLWRAVAPELWDATPSPRLILEAVLAGTASACVYHGKVPANRPVTDYTPRIVPAPAGAVIPLEAGFIL